MDDNRQDGKADRQKLTVDLSRLDRLDPMSRCEFLKLLRAGVFGITATAVLPQSSITGRAAGSSGDECKCPPAGEPVMKGHLTEVFRKVYSNSWFENRPERSGETIDACEHYDSDIQEAIDALSEDETLFIPADCGPYYLSSTLDLPETDHISIESDGARLINDGSGRIITAEDRSRDQDITTIQEPADMHATEIYIDDAEQHFEPGDDIFLFEDTPAYANEEEGTTLYDHDRDGGARGSTSTREYNTIEAIDGDRVTLEAELAFPYYLDNDTRVDSVDFYAEDVLISGMFIDGLEGGEYGESQTHSPLRVSGMKYFWMDDMGFRGGDSRSFRIAESMWVRLDRIDFARPNDYACSCDFRTRNVWATNLRVEDGGYMCRAGSDSNTILIDGVFSRQSGSTLNAHNGGFWYEGRNIRHVNDRDPDDDDYSSDGHLGRFRSRYMFVDQFELIDGARYAKTTSGIITLTMRNGYLSFEDHSDPVFRYRLDSPSPVYERIQEVLWENVYIEPYGAGPDDLGEFRETEIRDLTIRNVSYGGEPITMDHVEQWENWDDVINPENVTIEQPNPPQSPEDVGVDPARVPDWDIEAGDFPRHFEYGESELDELGYT
jgi:hypothetical protein